MQTNDKRETGDEYTKHNSPLLCLVYSSPVSLLYTKHNRGRCGKLRSRPRIETKETVLMLLHAALCSYQRRVLGLGPQRLAEVLGAERKTIFLFLAGLLPQGGEHRESTHLGIHNPIQTVGESGEQSRVLLFYLQEENMGGIRNTDTNLRDPLLIHHTRSIIITTFI